MTAANKVAVDFSSPLPESDAGVALGVLVGAADACGVALCGGAPCRACDSVAASVDANVTTRAVTRVRAAAERGFGRLTLILVDDRIGPMYPIGLADACPTHDTPVLGPQA